MKSAGKARNNGLYRHIRTSKEIIRNLLNDYYNSINRTPRTSPRQRVMCPRGDIFLSGGIGVGIKASYYL